MRASESIKVFLLDFSASEALPDFQMEITWAVGGRAEAGSSPSAEWARKALTGGQKRPILPWMERRRSQCSSLWLLETPRPLSSLAWLLPGLARQGLSTTAPQKSEDYRFAGGLSLLSHRLRCVLLSLGSTVTAVHCIRTLLGRPQPQVTAVRPRVPRRMSPHPLCLHLRTALAAGQCSFLLSLPPRLGSHGHGGHT